MTISAPPDLVIRIALLRGDDELEELSPSVWRRFRCSSAINLDVFQDKILQPIMGWCRNYHTYYFRQDKTFYYQDKSSAADAFGMHDSYRAVGGTRVDPTEFTVGDLLSAKGDACHYAYDLGDHWYHELVVEQIIEKITTHQQHGMCVVLDGAMRCPDEDGEGGHTYQADVLDLYNLAKRNPSEIRHARKYEAGCFQRVSAANVGGLFHADVFSMEQAQAAVQQALQSRVSFRMGAKGATMGAARSMVDIQRVEPGQRKKRSLFQDHRGEDGTPMCEPFFMNISEIVNIKPDPDSVALCATCGNPTGLKRCGGCQVVSYCSRLCQKSDWKSHKKTCKQDKRFRELCDKEEKGEAQVPQEEIDGGRRFLHKFDPENMRFKKGTTVECMVGEDMYVTGTVLEVLHECQGTVHAYQIQLDKNSARRMRIPFRSAQIWADWDSDYQIRRVDDPRSDGHMQLVD